MLIWPSPAAVAAAVVAAVAVAAAVAAAVVAAVVAVVAAAQIPGIRLMTDSDVPDVTKLLNQFLGSGEAKFYPVRPPTPHLSRICPLPIYDGPASPTRVHPSCNSFSLLAWV